MALSCACDKLHTLKTSPVQQGKVHSDLQSDNHNVQIQVYVVVFRSCHCSLVAVNPCGYLCGGITKTVRWTRAINSIFCAVSNWRGMKPRRREEKGGRLKGSCRCDELSKFGTGCIARGWNGQFLFKCKHSFFASGPREAPPVRFCCVMRRKMGAFEKRNRRREPPPK